MTAWLQIRAGHSAVPAAFLLAVLAGPVRAATTTVTVGPNGALMFAPARVTIDVGDTVKWIWGSGTHSTTRDQTPDTWDSGVSGSPHSFSHTFTRAGTFPYFCSVHQTLGMTGTVVVRQSAATTTTTISGASTTTITAAAALPACSNIDACRAALTAALPTAAAATTGRERRTLRLLDRLAKRADTLLAGATKAHGKKQHHEFTRVARALERLRRATDKAATRGTLTAPSAPIDTAVDSLITLVQAS